jgi:putative transposase
VSKPVSATGRLGAAIDELFGSDRDLASILEEVARIRVRLLLQTALEAEVDAFLGRERSQRRDQPSQPASRNGWQPPATVDTTMGAVELQRPKAARHRPGVLLWVVRRRVTGPTRWRGW